jgi:glutaredoxin 3
MEQVDIYTTRYCPYCAWAKTILVRKGIQFTEIDIAANWERRDEMIERAGGQSTVPQIFIGSTHVGGCKDLKELDRTGQLDTLIIGRNAAT